MVLVDILREFPVQKGSQDTTATVSRVVTADHDRGRRDWPDLARPSRRTRILSISCQSLLFFLGKRVMLRVELLRQQESAHKVDHTSALCVDFVDGSERWEQQRVCLAHSILTCSRRFKGTGIDRDAVIWLVVAGQRVGYNTCQLRSLHHETRHLSQGCS